MSGTYLTKSRHGTIYYFRRRVPLLTQQVIGHSVIVQSLETSDRRLAIIRARSLAARTDTIFQKIAMAIKSGHADRIRTDYTLKVDLDELGRPSSFTVDAQPDEQDAVNAAIRTVLENPRSARATPVQTKKTFAEALNEYFGKAQIKAQSKATYRSKLEHAQKFFGPSQNVLAIDQADFARYCDHVLETVTHITSQGQYMATAASFLNWHRNRTGGLSSLTTRTLIPRKDTPESDERDAFSLEQLALVFNNAKKYRESNPHKFWVSIAPAFLGCRIEELCQVHLKTDLAYDDKNDIWFFVFDGRADPDGVNRKSMKKAASWRRLPIHPALIRHGFLEFLNREKKAGVTRPFEREWKPREDESDLGKIIKWSHYISRWGGRELTELAQTHQFDAGNLTYFHSMRHTFKKVLGDARVSSEISEALSGRRYGGADAERYEKLKQNHQRLATEGILIGLDKLSALLDTALES